MVENNTTMNKIIKNTMEATFVDIHKLTDGRNVGDKDHDTDDYYESVQRLHRICWALIFFDVKRICVCQTNGVFAMFSKCVILLCDCSGGCRVYNIKSPFVGRE